MEGATNELKPSAQAAENRNYLAARMTEEVIITIFIVIIIVIIIIIITLFIVIIIVIIIIIIIWHQGGEIPKMSQQFHCFSKSYKSLVS